MYTGDTRVVGGEEAALMREIAACEARLRFLTPSGYDQTRNEAFRRELLERRELAVQSLAALRRTRAYGVAHPSV
jgi:hypothetical protein